MNFDFTSAHVMNCFQLFAAKTTHTVYICHMIEKQLLTSWCFSRACSEPVNAGSTPSSRAERRTSGEHWDRPWWGQERPRGGAWVARHATVFVEGCLVYVRQVDREWIRGLDTNVAPPSENETEEIIIFTSRRSRPLWNMKINTLCRFPQNVCLVFMLHFLRQLCSLINN